MVCRPVEKTTPPLLVCLVRAALLTSIVMAMYFMLPLMVEVIMVQRMSGPRGALYGCLETFAEYCQSNATKSSRWVSSPRAVFDTKKRASTSCAEPHTGSHQKSRKDFVYHGWQGVAGLVKLVLISRKNEAAPSQPYMVSIVLPLNPSEQCKTSLAFNGMQGL
jgi:hypothetical protein